ncbi:hypothetical protein GOBAR_DD03052 [Gossypium barbadense]|nr:hypothetical protein GOBAR_DD03052 [Gossypium barbadense]
MALENGAPSDPKAFCKELANLVVFVGGCKFTAEEERVVIELQAQFGNKWAKIATYLPGRTDNDVKNFWSSRQKRLARILQNSGAPSSSSSSSSSKSLKLKREIPAFHDVPVFERRGGGGGGGGGFNFKAPKLSSSMEEISYTMAQSCSSSSYLDSTETIIKVEQFPKLVNPKLYTDANMAQLELMSIGNNPYAAAEAQPQAFFPQIHTPNHTSHYHWKAKTCWLNSRTLTFHNGNVEQQPFLEPVRSGGFGAREEADNPMIPDAFFDDFPADMFDQMEPLSKSINLNSKMKET